MFVPLALALLIAAKPLPDARQDLLDAMVDEINRSQAELKLRENRGPYFIGYQLKDYDSREVLARYGGVFQDAATRDRKISVDVRVGDYVFDSSVGDDLDLSFALKGPSYLTKKSAPIDDDPAALRTALWLVTDEKYKAALFNFLKKKGDDVYAVEDPKRPPSFTREAPEVQLGAKVPFVFTRDRWLAFAREVSARLAREKAFFDSEVRISADKVVRYYVTTEGTRLVTEDTLFGIHVQAWTRADDGQLLEDSREFYAPLESQLPSDAAMKKETEVMVNDLLALRVAPTIDPYTGPAILEADAAGVLFHEAVGHRLEGERQDSDAEGKTFRGQVGRQVLPPFITVIDDATATERGGKQLNGHYLFDEEGVRAQKVTLVKAGVLQTYLLSRRPVEGFLKSNGHGRAQGNRKPIARMANLIVESTKRLPAAGLKAQLIAEAKRQGKPFGLLIRDITGGNTNTAGFGYQAFKGTPRMVYRVDLKTGAETLVRGVEIVGTPLSSMNRILATGQTEGVFNGFCGAESGMVPVSTVAPAVLLQELELQRGQEGKDRPPLIPSPVSLTK
ncbi:MAG: TldD/PmbA family protein [Archangium sp.]|nr:TldD/PmbA family protein [Archangium sp.]